MEELGAVITPLRNGRDLYKENCKAGLCYREPEQMQVNTRSRMERLPITKDAISPKLTCHFGVLSTDNAELIFHGTRKQTRWKRRCTMAKAERTASELAFPDCHKAAGSNAVRCWRANRDTGQLAQIREPETILRVCGTSCRIKGALQIG